MVDDGRNGNPSNVRRSTDGGATVEDWERLPADPELDADLGYEMIELDVIQTNNGSGDALMLPSDEDMLKEDAFIVASSDTVCNVGEWL